MKYDMESLISPFGDTSRAIYDISDRKVENHKSNFFVLLADCWIFLQIADGSLESK